jgi:hypothetical protein
LPFAGGKSKRERPEFALTPANPPANLLYSALEERPEGAMNKPIDPRIVAL